MTIHTPTLMGGNTSASAVERPATPPGAISFGTLNTAIAAEMSGQANRTVSTSNRTSRFFCCCAVSFALFIITSHHFLFYSAPRNAQYYILTIRGLLRFRK